jgi:5'-nucleotidase
LQGVKFTPLGVQEYDDLYVRDEKDEGRFWLTGKPVTHRRGNPDDCDIEWIKKGFITVTPIFYDMTNYAYLNKLRGKE